MGHVRACGHSNVLGNNIVLHSCNALHRTGEPFFIVTLRHFVPLIVYPPPSSHLLTEQTRPTLQLCEHTVGCWVDVSSQHDFLAERRVLTAFFHSVRISYTAARRDLHNTRRKRRRDCHETICHDTDTSRLGECPSMAWRGGGVMSSRLV